MAISNNNELDHLFSMALGENWAARGMKGHTSEELAAVQSLAKDHAEQVFLRLEAIGHALGGANPMERIDQAQLGWLIKELAEHGSVCLHIEETAKGLLNREDREAFLELVA